MRSKVTNGSFKKNGFVDTLCILPLGIGKPQKLSRKNIFTPPEKSLCSYYCDLELGFGCLFIPQNMFHREIQKISPWKRGTLSWKLVTRPRKHGTRPCPGNGEPGHVVEAGNAAVPWKRGTRP